MDSIIDLYYFSPTGGTKKTGEIFSKALGGQVRMTDLGERGKCKELPEGDLIVAAAPVFGGRIPALAAEKLGRLKGAGKNAVTIVVYGTRAYEDALLELNEVMEKAGFSVLASGAFIAQHSMAPEIGTGRPDEQDGEELREFARRVLEKLERGEKKKVHVPGNHPYKPEMKVAAAPLSLDNCTLCGKCERVCPTGAVRTEEGRIVTALENCILCAACVKACDQQARILPPQVQAHIQELLAPLKEVRRENKVFL